MRHARAYSSFCSQVILVCLHLFRCNSLFCSKKIAKKSLKTRISSRSFKVIDVEIPKKLVASACYNACLCLCATIFTLDNPTANE